MLPVGVLPNAWQRKKRNNQDSTEYTLVSSQVPPNKVVCNNNVDLSLLRSVLSSLILPSVFPFNPYKSNTALLARCPRYGHM